MRYLSIFRSASGEESGPPSVEHMQAMGRLIEEMTKSGHLLTTEPLAARERGARVKREGGEFTVSALTERAGGYALMRADSREEMVELLRKFLDLAGDGECEVREIMEFDAPPS